MEQRQLDILRNSKNVEILSTKIEAKDVIRLAIEKYPAYFTRRDFDGLRGKSAESRYRFIVNTFKDVFDGYVRLYEILVELGSTQAVLKLLRPGLKVKITAPPRRSPKPSRSAEAAKAKDFDQEALLKEISSMFKSQEDSFASQFALMQKEMKAIRNDVQDMKRKIDKIDDLERMIATLQADMTSGRNATSDLEKIVEKLCAELNKVKEKLKDIEKQQSIENMLQMLLGGKDVMRELENVKTNLGQLKLWMEEQCGMMTNRIDNLERESTGRMIARGDVKIIAVKIQTQWEVIAKEVGIEGETIKHSRGKQVLEGVAAAEAFICQWIEMDGKAATATGIPPTYDALYEIVKRQDKKVAEEIKELQKHAKE
ncbi:uncharacterized protein LOC144445993 isoform X1 [Glandiceps talaboti]